MRKIFVQSFGRSAGAAKMYLYISVSGRWLNHTFYNQAAAHLRASILFIFTLEIFLFLYPLSDLRRAISVLHLALTRLCCVCHLMATWQGMVRVQV